MNLSGPPAEVAQNGVGELALHLDVLLAGKRVARAAVRRAGVAEQLAKEVGQEVGQDFLFLEACWPCPTPAGRPSASAWGGRRQRGPATRKPARWVRRTSGRNSGLASMGTAGNLLEAAIIGDWAAARQPEIGPGSSGCRAHPER